MQDIQQRRRAKRDLQQRFREAQVSSDFRKIVGVFTLMVMPLFIYSGWQLVSGLLTQMKEASAIYAVQEKERVSRSLEGRFTEAMQYADAYYFADDLHQAQINYTLALSIKPDDKFANIGMTQTLCRQCLENNLFCAEAEDYVNYCREMQYKTDYLQQLGLE